MKTTRARKKPTSILSRYAATGCMIATTVFLFLTSSCSEENKGTLVIRWQVLSPIDNDPSPCSTSGINYIHLQLIKGSRAPSDGWPTYRFPCSQREVILTLQEGLYTVNILKEDSNHTEEVAVYQNVEVLSSTTTDLFGIYPPDPKDKNDVNIPWCGNGVIEPDHNEVCDDGLENSDTLPDRCRTDCTNFRCGDGVADTGEECDGTDLRGITCEDLGMVGDSPSCSTSCTIEPGTCVEPKADLTIVWEIYEQDGATLSTCENEDVETIRFVISPRNTSEITEQGVVDCVEGQAIIQDVPFDVYSVYLEGLSPTLELNASSSYPSHVHNTLEGTTLEINLTALE